jgi:hypothetical protein
LYPETPVAASQPSVTLAAPALAEGWNTDAPRKRQHIAKIKNRENDLLLLLLPW